MQAIRALNKWWTPTLATLGEGLGMRLAACHWAIYSGADQAFGAHMADSGGSLSKVRAVERAMALLRAFGPTSTRLSLAELTRLSGLDKGTTRRILQTLASGDFIEFDDTTKTYSLGPGILLLLPGVRYGSDLRDVAAPALTRLAEESGATSYLWTYFDGFAMCLDRVKSPELHIDTLRSGIGTRVTLNHSAGPRVLLAYLSAEERGKVLGAPLEQPTSRSVVDPAMLEASAAKIRKQGWEFATDDYALGMSALGVPVLNARGELVASVSIASLTPQFSMADGRPELLSLVQKTALDIGARLRPG